jgi:hypothetical protein
MRLPYRFPLALAFAATLALSAGAPPAPAYEERAPEPTAAYPSLDVARDSLGLLIGRVVREVGGPGSKTIGYTRRPVRFGYWYASDSTKGWEYDIVVKDSSECPMSKLEYALYAAGWAPDYGYAADGPDGGVLGFVSKESLCVVEGRWDGGDDADSTYVPDVGCEVTVTCVPRRKDDVPRE